MFLQLVTGGHLLIFVARAEKWFFLRPFPAAPLVLAILGTQVLAVLMAGLGWLVPDISWAMVGLVLLYSVIWVFIMGAVRNISETLLDHRTSQQRRTAALVRSDLRPLPH